MSGHVNCGPYSSGDMHSVSTVPDGPAIMLPLESTGYVDTAPAGSDNADCTMQKPCIKLSAALATNKPFIKLHGVTDEATSINNQNVTLIADPRYQQLPLQFTHEMRNT